MADKPKRASEYMSEHLELVRSTCLYVATKLGDLMDEVVIVGGLVPSLLIDQSALPDGVSAHVGTMVSHPSIPARSEGGPFQPSIPRPDDRYREKCGGQIVRSGIRTGSVSCSVSSLDPSSLRGGSIPAFHPASR